MSAARDVAPEPDPRRAALAKLSASLRAMADAVDVLSEPEAPKPGPTGLLRFKAAGAILGCDATHVSRLARRGALELVYLGEASPRVTAASVDELIRKGGVSTASRRRMHRPSLLEWVTGEITKRRA